MSPDPLAIAFREIAEARRLLEALILSSESFDYPQAKTALEQLNEKVRSLGRLQSEWATAQAQLPPVEGIIPFPGTVPVSRPPV